MNTTAQQPHFLKHSEVQAYLSQHMPIIIAESDRGAVLLGLSYIDELLGNFYEKLLPSEITKKEKKNILRSFQHLATKTNVALTCRLLPYSLIQAIDELRSIRNVIAHRTEVFALTDHENSLRRMFSLLGEGVSTWINHCAVHMMMSNSVNKVMHAANEDKDPPYFKDEFEVMEFLSGDLELLDEIGSGQLKWELALGIMLIFAMIIFHREKVLSLVGDKTLCEIV